MSFRVLIADDEPLARLRIRTLLEDHPDLTILRECADGLETVDAIQYQSPEILFLDIQMPRLDGFGVLEALGPDTVPAVIFTTAHDQHALRAFEVHALDYLLKPFSEARFRAALDRARKTLERRSESVPDPKLGSLLASLRSARGGGPRIPVKLPDRLIFVRADQVAHIESAGNYVVVHAGQERHVVRETLTAMERRLAGAGFHRLSRSLLVNLHHIRELQPLGESQYCVVLRNGCRLAMTCSLRDLQERMNDL